MMPLDAGIRRFHATAGLGGHQLLTSGRRTLRTAPRLPADARMIKGRSPRSNPGRQGT
jgi:hypothetical protein